MVDCLSWPGHLPQLGAHHITPDSFDVTDPAPGKGRFRFMTFPNLCVCVCVNILTPDPDADRWCWDELDETLVAYFTMESTQTQV